MRECSRVIPAQEALNDYRERIKQQLDNDGIIYQTIYARDSQRSQSTNTEHGPA